MKRTIYLIVFLMAGMFFTANAQSNWAGINSYESVPADVRLVQSNIQNTRIQFSLDGYKETPLETPRGTQMVISVGEGVQIIEKGKPDMAKLASTIIITDMDEMEVNVVSYEYQEFTGVEVAPSKGHFVRSINPDDVPFTYGEVYQADAFWPGELAQLEDPFIMRDFRGQTVTIFPFHYNPVSKTLRVYTDIVVDVSSTGNIGEDPFMRTRDEIVLEPEFGRIYERFFLNMEAAERSYPMLEGEEGSMLIICYDDFMDAMKPFVDWKRTIGRKTEIVPRSEAGNTWQQIKSYVEDYYDQNEDFAYLLLVGDAPNQIPAGIGTYGNDSDNIYGIISGMYNDIFVGRFSAETVAHVETQVQRMIEYERDIDESDTWLSNGLGVARNEGPGHYGEYDHEHMNFIRDTLLNFTYDVVHSCYDGPGHHTTAAEISGHINDGVSTINYCNHGFVTAWSVAGYAIYHVNQLTNVGKLPYVQSVACVNGDFVNQFCFAEAWLRATHDGEPTGAIGFLGATINQLWNPPMCGQDEMVSIKTEESIAHGSTIKRTYGGVSTNGSMFMIPQYGGSGIDTHETWILFGDPSLMVRTDVPTPFEPEYPSEISMGDESFTVTSIDDGATAALSYIDDNDEVIILGTAIAQDGTAEIIFDEPLEEEITATLAITGFNKVTYINDEIESLANYTVTFEIENEDGKEITDAIITFDGSEYEPGEYVIENVEKGNYDYLVEKDGFFNVEDDVTVEQDITVEVIMIGAYIVTFEIEDEDGNEITDAVITFDDVKYDPGEYVIEDIEAGTYDYKVEKEGFLSVEDNTEVDDDVTVKVIMETDTYVDTPVAVELSVFPNPARDKFTVESSEMIKQIKIIDISGQTVKDMAVGGLRSEISVNNLKAGVYFMQIHTKQSIITERVQIAR